MDSTVSPRLVTGLFALLFCVVASLRAGDVKPVRMVTEVVGIVMVSPRVAQAAAPADADAGVLQLAASGTDQGPFDPTGPMSAERWQPAKVPAAPAVRPAAPQPAAAQTATGKGVARTSTQVARAASAAKPRTGGKVRTKPAQPAPVLAQSDRPAPEVPALFVPLRRLGLSIQAKLPGAPATVAPAAKPANPRGSTAA